MIQLDVIVITGLVTSVLAEIFLLVPWLAATDLRKKWTALILAFVVSLYTLLSLNNFSLANLGILFVEALGAAFLIFKSLITPVEQVLGIGRKSREVAG